MTTTNQLFLNSFINEPPRHVLDSTHIQLISTLKANEELADYFRDRAQVEELYVKSLSKLTRKHQLSNKAIFGTFLPMWERLYQEITLVCNIHSEYSKKTVQEIEQPLRQCMMNNSDYHKVQSMEESLVKMCKENEELEFKIQKHQKAGSKGESKAIEYIKQQERKHQEWLNKAPVYLQSHQAVNEYQWTLMKSLVQNFELFQQDLLEKRLNLTKTALDITNSLTIENEIIQFCSTNTHQSKQNNSFGSTFSDPSLKNVSIPNNKKKRLFPSFGSIRRRSKNILHDIPRQDIQRNFSHTGSLVEINSVRRDHQDQHRQNTIPHLRKAASFAAATLTRQQPIQSKESIPVTDSEGFSIPPEKNHTWPSETSEFLMEPEEMSSDAGSNIVPRLRINIKNESVQDGSNETDALARVASLLKEKSPTTRKLRGRREGRTAQLYSVKEQRKTLLESSEEIINQPPTMDVSITETLDVLSRSGQIEHATLTGQVYVQYTGPTQSPLPVCFQLITPPDTTLQLTDHVCPLSDDIYQLNHADLTQSQSVILTYQTPLHHLPLQIKSMWKCEADKSRLLIKYQKNTDRLENVMLATSVLDVQDTQSIPSGEINLAQHRIKWDLLEIQGLIKAQFQTRQEREAQPIAVRFESQELFSGLQVKQGDDVNVLWVNIREIKKRAKTGKFIVF